MKNPRRALCLLLAAGTSLWAQTPREQPPVTLARPAAVHRTPEELDRLLGPIALYPDALIALILPAATVPTDIVLAARYLRDNPNNLSQVENRAWDDSVKSLTHYPAIVQWMDENLTWTKQVGEAFIEEPAEVMKTIQRLRARARAAGTLVDTPQQQVLSEADVLRIVPTQPDIIYVPRYEPTIVFGYRPTYYSQPLMTFGLGFSVGPWLAYDCDWQHRTIWVGNRHRSWHGHDWRRPVVPIQRGFFNPSVARPWHPPARPPRSAVAPTYYSRGHVVEPTPLSDAPRPAPRSFADRGMPAGTRVAPEAGSPPSDPAAPGPAPESARQHSGPRGARPGFQRDAVASPARPPENGTAVHRGPRPERQQETADRRDRTFPSVTVNSLPAHVAPPLPTVAPLLPARPNPAPRPERSHPRSTPAPAVAPPPPNAAPPPTAAPAPQPPAPPPQARSTPPPAQGDRNERRGRYNEP